MRYALAVVLLASALFGTGTEAALAVDVIHSVGGLPPHIVGLFEEPLGFQQSQDGLYYVFDRRGHSVYTVDADKKAARKVVEIGQELGRIIQPRGFDTASDGSFVVADSPRNVDRVQMFGTGGTRFRRFTLPARQRTAEITSGSVVMGGIATIQYNGANLIISHPAGGSLFTEYRRSGFPLRNIGNLRDTGHEEDRDLHLALNVGFPVVDPTGGFYYVFAGGLPIFRKYDSNGRLLFERHIEGTELDGYLAAMPTRWRTRRAVDGELPIVEPVIRAAAVDARGYLWISFARPFTYVYDTHGDKVRTVQFRAAGVISPTSLSFAPNGRLLVTPGCYEFDPTAL